jgi:hypothetical protein
MNSGRAYEIVHPEFIRVGRDSWLFYHQNQPDGPYERFDILSLLLIERVEFIDATANTPGNGAA